jgi:hypothetical protein
MSEYKGGCICGAVRYTAKASPLVVRACWCRVCQYIGSGNATINLAFPADSVAISGELKDYASSADSGNHMHRRFCPKCGVHVFSHSDERSGFLVVRAGTLDDPSAAVPQANIWTKSAPAWAQFDPSLPKFEGQPPPPTPKPLVGG